MKVEVKRLEFCTGGRSDDRIVLETLILLCLAHIQKPGGIDRTRLQILESSVLIDDVEAETRRSHLLYVSLETCTSCNHRCPFCPVSVDPRGCFLSPPRWLRMDDG